MTFFVVIRYNETQKGHHEICYVVEELYIQLYKSGSGVVESFCAKCVGDLESVCDEHIFGLNLIVLYDDIFITKLYVLQDVHKVF